MFVSKVHDQLPTTMCVYLPTKTAKVTGKKQINNSWWKSCLGWRSQVIFFKVFECIYPRIP